MKSLLIPKKSKREESSESRICEKGGPKLMLSGGSGIYFFAREGKCRDVPPALKKLLSQGGGGGGGLQHIFFITPQSLSGYRPPTLSTSVVKSKRKKRGGKADCPPPPRIRQWKENPDTWLIMQPIQDFYRVYLSWVYGDCVS